MSGRMQSDILLLLGNQEYVNWTAHGFLQWCLPLNPKAIIIKLPHGDSKHSQWKSDENIFSFLR